jgi:DNA-binding response OmpR family regulator
MNNTKGRILIIEDHTVAQKTAVILFETFGYAVDAANDGWQAIRLFEQQAYDLILIDLGLPNGFDGFTVARQIRACSAVPLIIVSANTDAENQELALKIGINVFLEKPFTMEKARGLIRQFLPDNQHK